MLGEVKLGEVRVRLGDVRLGEVRVSVRVRFIP